MAIAAELARRRPALSLPGNAALIVAGAVVVEVMLGMAIAIGHARLALLAVVAAAAGMAIVRFPFATTCVTLFSAAGVLTEEIPALSFGITLFPFEPLLGALLLLAIVRPRRRTWGGLPGLLLALFLGTLVLSSLVAWREDKGPLTEILLSGRGYFMLAFFWVILRLFPGRRETMRVLTAAAVVGALTGFVSLLLAVKLDPSALLLSPNDNALREEGGALMRVRLPGLALAFAMLPLVLFFAARGRRPRWLWPACLVAILGAVLVSFNRNMWVAGTAALLLILVLTGPLVRGRIVATAGILLAAVALFIAMPATSEPANDVLRPLIARGETLFNPRAVTAEESLRDRDNENRAAWSAAQDNLLLGVAPGVPWGLYTSSRDGNRTVYEPQLFVHNQYLFLLLITGLPGLLLLAGFLVSSIAAALRQPRVRPEAAVAGIGLIAIMLTAVVMLSLSDGNYLLGVAVLAGSIPGLLEPEEATR